MTSSVPATPRPLSPRKRPAATPAATLAAKVHELNSLVKAKENAVQLVRLPARYTRRAENALLVQHLLTESVRLQHETAQQKVVTSAVDVQAARELLELRKKHAELQAEHGRLTDAASSRGDATTAAWRALEQCGALLGRAVERLHQESETALGVVDDRRHGRLEVSTQREAQLEAEEAALRDEVEKLQKQLDERSKLADSSSTEQQRLLGDLAHEVAEHRGQAKQARLDARILAKQIAELDASVSDARRRAAADKIARGGAAPPLPRALSAARQGSAGGSSAPSRDATPAAQRAELLKHYRAAEKGRAAEQPYLANTDAARGLRDRAAAAPAAAPAAAAAAPAAAPAVGEYARYLQLKEKFRGRLAK